MSFYENYVFLCNSIGKAPSAVAIEIGLSKPAVNRWKGGGVPTDATARKVARYFNVSPEVLLKSNLPIEYGLYAYGTLLKSSNVVESSEETKKTPTPKGEREELKERVFAALESAEPAIREAALRLLGVQE